VAWSTDASCEGGWRGRPHHMGQGGSDGHAPRSRGHPSEVRKKVAHARPSRKGQRHGLHAPNAKEIGGADCITWGKGQQWPCTQIWRAASKVRKKVVHACPSRGGWQCGVGALRVEEEGGMVQI
jgi:hypothetical protein